MEGNPYSDIPLRDEPDWPAGHDGPYLFLLDASSHLERSLLEGWVERHRPDTVDPSEISFAAIPTSRRRRRLRSRRMKLDADAHDQHDPLLVPLRVAWLPPVRHGRRVVGWRDLLSFGDPRDPNAVRQHVIFRTRPDRVTIVAGDVARMAEVHARFVASEASRDEHGRSAADILALQAALSLERAERRLRGSQYKVPKFLNESLHTSGEFSRGIANLAREADARFDQMSQKTLRYLNEMAATHSPYVIDLMAGGIRWLVGKAYSGLHYDSDQLGEIYSIGQQHPLVFLPSHKSNFDHLVLQYVLYENELPPNHTAGGINMNFFPIGPILRRSGVFFIRREFKENAPYKFVLRKYIDYLLGRRFPLEWYIEGGRSRSGKLREPRLGMLAYVVDSYRGGSADDVVLVPVSLAYDQIQDVGAYAAEQQGGGKEKESFGWMLRALRSIRRRYGAIHVRFGEPVSLLAELGPPGGQGGEASTDRLEVPKLAFEVCTRINDVTPITPISLVALALLTVGERSLSVEETMAVLEPFLDYVKRRDLPTTETVALDTPERVRNALDDLIAHGVVSRFDGATQTVYRVGPKQHLAAAYYRNTIIHFFVNSAIAELALVHVGKAAVTDSSEAFYEEALRIRDLLKFEFFFSDKDEFLDEMRAELALQDSEWAARLAAGDVQGLLLGMQPFRSHAVLRPFLEAYRVVGDLIDSKAFLSLIDKDELLSEALSLGQQYHLQGRIQTGESVSSLLFRSAVRLAENRNLLLPGSDIIERRRAFASQLQDTVSRFAMIEAVMAGREAGLLD